jgi:DNA-directed RNA polymerase sigma subunit (sigma70/sigma32)
MLLTLAFGQRPSRLSDLAGPRDDRPIELVLRDPRGNYEDSVVDTVDVRGALHRLLTEREERVLRARFGIDEDERTLADLAREFRCSPQAVKKMQDRALGKLRNSLTAEW